MNEVKRAEGRPGVLGGGDHRQSRDKESQGVSRRGSSEPSQSLGDDVTGVRGDGETERIPFSSWAPSHTEPDVASESFSAQGTSDKHDTAPLGNLVHTPITILSDCEVVHTQVHQPHETGTKVYLPELLQLKSSGSLSRFCVFHHPPASSLHGVSSWGSRHCCRLRVDPSDPSSSQLSPEPSTSLDPCLGRTSGPGWV